MTLASVLLSPTRIAAQVPTETLVFAPLADVYVDGSSPKTNFNADDRLRVDGSPRRVAFLRFAVAGVNGRRVHGARLRLRVSTGSESGGTVHLIRSGAWKASTVTYSTRPVVDAAALDAVGAVESGATAEFDLAGAIARDGVHELAIQTASADGVTYRDSTAPAGQKPVLVLDVDTRPQPTVTIVQPRDGSTAFAGDTVTFQGAASDVADGDLSTLITWTSSIQGPLGVGAVVTPVVQLGTHVVTATVTDRDGLRSSAEIALVVTPRPAANTAPLVAITAPTDGQALLAGPVSFSGSAHDLEDGDLTGHLRWISSLDGPLGVGGLFTGLPRPGTHVVTASITDSSGARATAEVSVTIVSSAPLVTIDAPAAWMTVPVRTSVTFRGTATDVTDGDVAATLRWTSDRDGLIGQGPTFSTRSLTAGVHVVTATAVDRSSLQGQAQRRLVVQAAKEAGFKDFRFGRQVDQDDNRATASKPESKLWYHDDSWWATLFSPAGRGHRIHRLDQETQRWIDTGVLVDERKTSRQDVLSEGQTLYIASRFGGKRPQNQPLRFTYDPTSRAYVRDAGFPVNISGGGTESLTIAKDSTGALWIAYTFGRKVYVNTTLGNDMTWGTPFVIPVPLGTRGTRDDIAAVHALPGQIGVFWGNQRTDAFYFAVHHDGAPATSAWRLEVVAQGGKVADDHFNLKLAPDKRVFVAVKTSHVVLNESLIGLFVRSPTGVWSPLYEVANVDANSTRPVCALDEVQRRVYVFYSPGKSGIHYKSTDIDHIDFATSARTRFIDSTTTTDINNPTTSKHNVTPGTGLVVVASSPSDTSYWHGTIQPE